MLRVWTDAGRWTREHLDRRIGPLLVSVLFVILGCAYVFWWAGAVQHKAFLWLVPGDIGGTYLSATELAFGHFGSIYRPEIGHIDAFPGILVLLAPLGALATTFRTTLVRVAQHHHPVAHAQVVYFHPSGILSVAPGPLSLHGDQYMVQAQWVQFVVPYALALSCAALVACDALAERLGVARRRRVVLAMAEAVLLWNVAVLWGHPEDAVALALAVYALVFTMDRRLVGAGWLFGAAVCFQPLVLLMLPVLLVAVGWPAALGMTVRAVLPTAVLVAPPLAAGFKTTVQALADQRAFPNINHQTPWTALSPHISGRDRNLTVASGPGRLLSVLLASGVGAGVRRWRERPELLAAACALGLFLWPLTESVMTAYYVWPALALGLAVAAKADARRFGVALVLSVAVTVVAQWHLGWLPWWLLVVGGTALVLAASARPAPVEPELVVEPGRLGLWMADFIERQKPERPPVRTKAGASAAAKRRRKAARTSRKRTGRR